MGSESWPPQNRPSLLQPGVLQCPDNRLSFPTLGLGPNIPFLGSSSSRGFP